MLGVVDNEGEFVSPIQSLTMPAATTRLEQNSPNPFNPQTAIRFTLDAKQSVSLSVYDVSGRLVRNLADRQFLAGEHEILWAGLDNGGRQVARGVFFTQVRFMNSKFSAARKLTVLK